MWEKKTRYAGWRKRAEFFFVRSLYSSLEEGRSMLFPFGIVWNA